MNSYQDPEMFCFWEWEWDGICVNFQSQEFRPIGLCASVLLYTSRPFIKEVMFPAPISYPMKDIVWNVSCFFFKTCQLNQTGSTIYSEITK